jgi:hypothetical protein
MQKGSKVIVTNDVFTGVEGTLEEVVCFGNSVVEESLRNTIYANIRVDVLNVIKVPIGDVTEVTELNE